MTRSENFDFACPCEEAIALTRAFCGPGIIDCGNEACELLLSLMKERFPDFANEEEQPICSCPECGTEICL